jgi:hypothetical protein
VYIEAHGPRNGQSDAAFHANGASRRGVRRTNTPKQRRSRARLKRAREDNQARLFNPAWPVKPRRRHFGTVNELSSSIASTFRDHAGYRAIQQIPGVGPVIGAILVAEIGDVHRFTSAAHLASWCGVTPRHRESDTTVRRGPITKQGSKLVRWAAIEAAQQLRKDSWLHDQREQLAQRRNNRSIAKTAIARKIITLVYYGLRDGHIRCLDPAA